MALADSHLQTRRGNKQDPDREITISRLYKIKIAGVTKEQIRETERERRNKHK